MRWDRIGRDRLAGRTRERHGIGQDGALRPLDGWQRSDGLARH